MPKQNRWIFLVLCVLFLVYSFGVYTAGTSNEQLYVEDFRKGQQLWQKHNCSACHQLYGLGGYLGPDLTNVADKGKDYLSAFLKSGLKSMPVFSLTPEEEQALFVYLTKVNESGYFPNHNVEISRNGNFKLKDDINYEE